MRDAPGASSYGSLAVGDGKTTATIQNRQKMDNVQQYVELPTSDYDAWRRRVVDGGHQNESGTSVAYELQAPRRRKYYLHIKIYMERWGRMGSVRGAR